MTTLDELIYSDAQRLDDLWYGLGDVYDLKSSAVLVVVAFLGSIAAILLTTRRLPLWAYRIEILAVAFLVVAGACSLRALWPRDFNAPPATKTWFDENLGLQQNAKVQEWLKLTIERERVNKAAAKRKMKWLKLSLWAIIIAFALDVVLLIGLLLPHLICYVRLVTR